jgi:hypothetical protein
LASHIVEVRGYATGRRDGVLVQRAVRYLRQMRKVVSDVGVRGVMRRFPDIFMATKVFGEPSTRTLEIRARVLAGQSNRAIGRAVGLPEKTIETLLDLFFDVRDRLEAGSWIRRQAIGLQLDQAPSLESLMLLHAWRHGPGVIPAWFDFIDHQTERHDLSSDLGRQRASIQLFVDVQQLASDGSTKASLAKKAHFILGNRTKTVNSVSAAGVFSQMGARILEEIAFEDARDQENDMWRDGRETNTGSQKGLDGGSARVA